MTDRLPNIEPGECPSCGSKKRPLTDGVCSLCSLLKFAKPGVCACGCGTPTKISTYRAKAFGAFPGQPLPFVRGHGLYAIRWAGAPEYLMDAATGCWNWARKIHTAGYGMIGNRYAHRIFHQRFKGPIPDGFDIDHLCRNHRCVNPDHLEAVPHQINNCRGLRAKLSPDVVKEMVRQRSLGKSYRAIGRMFTVNNATVWRAVNAESWSFVHTAPEPIQTILPRVLADLREPYRDAS